MTVARDMLEVRLFGGFSLTYAGRPLPPLPSRTARLLFAWMVLHAGRAQPRSLLADRFWPEATEARARRRLSHSLWQLQDSISEVSPDHVYLVTRGDEVVFDAATPYWLDVEEFEQRLDRIDQAQQVDDPGLRSLRSCVSLYQGELLAGSYEQWVVEEQERLRQRYVNALGHVVDACKQRGNFEEALTFAQRLTHEAPLREDVHREVMRLCVLLGRQSQALEQFERCRSVLMEELGTSPSAATVELRERITQTRDVSVARRAPVEQLVSRRLVGRDDHRHVLVDHMERTLAGVTSHVFVEGEPGIGKSQLLTQAADDARWRGLNVLWGECGSVDEPYAAIREALEPELGAVRLAQLRAHVAPVWLAEASRLLAPLAGALSMAAPSAGLSGQDAAQRMRDALVQVVVGLAAIEPIMLVIEDAHLADPETLELLRALGRFTDPMRLMLVVSFRDEDARQDDDVWAGLRGVDRDLRPTRLQLSPLTAFETAALLREVLATTGVPATFTEAVHRESGGNPLYALELLRSLRDSGLLNANARERLDAVTVPVTDDLRAVIGERLDYLDEAADEVAGFGALLGDEFLIETLRAGVALDPRDFSAAVGELVRRNLLEVSGVSCRFTHAATRRVVVERIGDERALDLHLRAADALEATQPTSVEALARHLLAANQPVRARPYLTASADKALDLHAYTTAATQLQAAIATTHQGPVSVDERLELLLRYEEVLGVLGRRDDQRCVLDELSDLAAGHARHVEVLIRTAAYLGHVDEFADAVVVATQAVEGTRVDQGLWHGRALAALGQVRLWAGEHEAAEEGLKDATDLLADEPIDVARALFLLGSARRLRQRFDPARQALERARELAEAHDDQVGLVQALGALADLHAETGQTGEAVTLHHRAVEVARSIGYRHREGVSLVNLGTVELSRGAPYAARVAYDEAIDIFERLGSRRGVAMVQLNRAWLAHRWLGDDDAAERDAREARRYFRQIGHLGLVAVCMETLAGVVRRRGDPDRARELLEEGLEAARSAGDQRAEIQLHRGRFELAMSTGDAENLSTVLDDTLRRARALELREFLADLLSLQALVTADDERAQNLASEASDVLDGSAEPHRIHFRLAQVAERVGEQDPAQHHLQTAVRLLHEALEPFDERVREQARTRVEEHQRLTQSATSSMPRVATLQMARRSAPRGRALQPGEMVEVRLQVGPVDAEPNKRRAQLSAVLDQVSAQDAVATVHDLAEALEVSVSTIRRDLKSLRQQGLEAVTRGTGHG